MDINSFGIYKNKSSGGGGTIGGSGTLNYIAKFTPDGTHIGNSQIFDDGISVQIQNFISDINNVESFDSNLEYSISWGLRTGFDEFGSQSFYYDTRRELIGGWKSIGATSDDTTYSFISQDVLNNDLATIRDDGFFGIGTNTQDYPFVSNFTLKSQMPFGLWADFKDIGGVAGLTIRKDNNIPSAINLFSGNFGNDASSILMDGTSRLMSFNGYPYSGQVFNFMLNDTNLTSDERFAIGSGSHGVDSGSNIYFYGAPDSSSQDQFNYASLQGLKENSTNNDYKAYLSFLTSDGSGSLFEGMRINSSQETYFNNYIIDISGSSSIDSNDRYLYNSYGTNILDWENDITYDVSGVQSIDLNGRSTNDSFGFISSNYDVRQLYANDGSTLILDWSDTTNTVSKKNYQAGVSFTISIAKTITHNLNTKGINVSIFDNTTGNEVNPTIVGNRTLNSVDITMPASLASSDVIIMG